MGNPSGKFEFRAGCGIIVMAAPAAIEPSTQVKHIVLVIVDDGIGIPDDILNGPLREANM